MSIHAISWALQQPISSSSAKFVLVAIANYADAYGRCWPSQQALAADTSMSERSIRTAISKLEEMGLLERVERRRKDGSRASDIIQIPALTAGRPQPEDFAGSVEYPGKPTGKIFRNNRKNTTNQPAGFSGLTTFEPSIEPSKDIPVRNHAPDGDVCHSTAVTHESNITQFPASKRERISYPADFERFWSEYPTDPNMAKKEAATAWTRLPPDDKQMAIDSIPRFKAYCAQNPTYRPVHACRFLSQRRFEGHMSAPEPGKDSRASTFGRS